MLKKDEASVIATILIPPPPYASGSSIALDSKVNLCFIGGTNVLAYATALKRGPQVSTYLIQKHDGWDLRDSIFSCLDKCQQSDVSNFSI